MGKEKTCYSLFFSCCFAGLSPVCLGQLLARFFVKSFLLSLLFLASLSLSFTSPLSSLSSPLSSPRIAFAAGWLSDSDLQAMADAVSLILRVPISTVLREMGYIWEASTAQGFAMGIRALPAYRKLYGYFPMDQSTLIRMYDSDEMVAVTTAQGAIEAYRWEHDGELPSDSGSSGGGVDSSISKYVSLFRFVDSMPVTDIVKYSSYDCYHYTFAYEGNSYTVLVPVTAANLFDSFSSAGFASAIVCAIHYSDDVTNLSTSPVRAFSADSSSSSPSIGDIFVDVSYSSSRISFCSSSKAKFYTYSSSGSGGYSYNFKGPLSNGYYYYNFDSIGSTAMAYAVFTNSSSASVNGIPFTISGPPAPPGYTRPSAGPAAPLTPVAPIVVPSDTIPSPTSIPSPTTSDLSPITQWMMIINQNINNWDQIISNWLYLLYNLLADFKISFETWMATISSLLTNLYSGQPTDIKQPGFWNWLTDLSGDVITELPDDTSLRPLTGNVNALSRSFPFSLPWDVLAFLTLIKADPVTPVIDFPFPVLTNSGLDTESINLHMSLSWLDDAMPVVRRTEYILFLVGLALQTRKLAAPLFDLFRLKGGDSL